MNAEVKALIETTDSQIRGVSKAYIALDGTDYNLFSKEEKNAGRFACKFFFNFGTTN